MKKPTNLMPVVATIAHQGDLGLSIWTEVVFYDDVEERWQSFSGSKTFNDGEQVNGWTYCHEIEMKNN